MSKSRTRPWERAGGSPLPYYVAEGNAPVARHTTPDDLNPAIGGGGAVGVSIYNKVVRACRPNNGNAASISGRTDALPDGWSTDIESAPSSQS